MFLGAKSVLTDSVFFMSGFILPTLFVCDTLLTEMLWIDNFEHASLLTVLWRADSNCPPPKANGVALKDKSL